MRKLNSTCEFASQRSELLIQSFRRYLATQSKISLNNALNHIVEAPAPRFWVSENRALRVVKLLLKGEDPTLGMHHEKRMMYLEIFRRVQKLRDENPGRPLGDIVFTVVNSSAPRFYITPKYANELMYKYKKGVKI